MFDGARSVVDPTTRWPLAVPPAPAALFAAADLHPARRRAAPPAADAWSSVRREIIGPPIR
jgi:hypothetical protein